MATHTTHDYERQQKARGIEDVKKRAPGSIMGSEDLSPGEEDRRLLEHCRELWDGLRGFRDRRARARRYHRGDQWGDLIKDPDTGDAIREDKYILNQGRVPLKQNIIRQLFKNLMGQFVNNPMATIVYARNRDNARASEIMGNAIRSVHDINYMDRLQIAAFQEFALSGMIVGKQRYSYIPEKNTEDITIDLPNANRIFFNSDTTDPRQNDIRVIGEIHDIPIMDLVTSFAENEAQEKKIRQWYTTEYFDSYIESMSGLTAEVLDHLDFYITQNPGMARVVEVWTKSAEWRTYEHDMADGTYKITTNTLDQIDAINAQRVLDGEEMGMPPEGVPLIEARRKYDHFWIVKYMTPYGHVLYEGETPYDHGEHPYVIALYPGIDGEVWGIVEDIIDQQRYVNRAFTLMDFIVGSSAKGVLLVPEDAIPDDMTIGDFADEWTKVNGIIKYRQRPGTTPPQQITNNSVPVGLQEMLSAQLKLSYDIAGIHQAVQGQQAKSGTPASLYAQEAQNATTNIRDFMQTFLFFREKMDNKTMLLIKQFYQEKRWLIVNEPNYTEQARMYDPDEIHETILDLKVTQGPDTPVYRQLVEDTLITLFQAQAIDAEMLLENSSLPYADKLLESIRKRKQQMEEEMQSGGGQIDPAMVEEMKKVGMEAQSKADPRAMAMINQAIS